MKNCFCGLDHSNYKNDEHALLSTAYHDIIQGAYPDKEWQEAVFELLNVRECTVCKGSGSFLTLETIEKCPVCGGKGVV